MNRNTEISKNIPLDMEKVFEVQKNAEDTLWDAEHKTGLWKDDPDAPPEEKKEHEDVRLTTIEENKTLLQNVNLASLNIATKIPLVQMTEKALNQYRNEFPDQVDKFENETFLLLGEVLQCSGHIVIMNIRTNEIISMVHSDSFELCNPLEV